MGDCFQITKPPPPRGRNTIFMAMKGTSEAPICLFVTENRFHPDMAYLWPRQNVGETVSPANPSPFLQLEYNLRNTRAETSMSGDSLSRKLPWNQHNPAGASPPLWPLPWEERIGARGRKGSILIPIRKSGNPTVPSASYNRLLFA